MSNDTEGTGVKTMATLVGQKMYWALYEKVLPCRVLKQDLTTATVEVLLENGARHQASAYDVMATEEGARARQRGLIREGATVTHKFLGASEISAERRNQLWEQAQVNGRTDDDLYGRLLAQEVELMNIAPQPAPDAGGEWRYAGTKHAAEIVINDKYILRIHWTGLGDTEEVRAIMRQVMSDHTRAAVVPKLVDALIDARNAAQVLIDSKYLSTAQRGLADIVRDVDVVLAEVGNG